MAGHVEGFAYQCMLSDMSAGYSGLRNFEEIPLGLPSMAIRALFLPHSPAICGAMSQMKTESEVDLHARRYVYKNVCTRTEIQVSRGICIYIYICICVCVKAKARPKSRPSLSKQQQTAQKCAFVAAA